MPTGVYERKTRSLKDRFEEKYVPEPNSGCFIWTAFLRHGYGTINDTYSKYAHRVSWELYRGVIPDGHHVLHRCDNTACVNPDHLFLGTHRDNMTDMHKKGRASLRRGDASGSAKITTVQAQEILNSSDRNYLLAERFGLDPCTISAIKAGRIWKHLRKEGV